MTYNKKRKITQRCPACGMQVEDMSEHLDDAHPENLTGTANSEHQRRLLARGATPWGLRTILIVSITFGIGAACTLTAFNWRRLGHVDFFVPTLLLALFSTGLFEFFVLPQLDLSSVQNIAIRMFANLGFGVALWLWQKETYHWWNSTYQEAIRAGPGVPLAVCVVWVCIRISSQFV
jgi:hypothetical protein